MRIISLCLLAPLLACSEPMSAPQLEEPSYRTTVLRDRFRFPFETSAFDCTGELIELIGYNQIFIQTLFNTAGVQKQFVIHERVVGTGYSQTTGAKYEFRSNFRIVGQTTIDERGAASFSASRKVHLIAQGLRDNRVFVEDLHIVTKNGTIERVTREIEFIECRG